MLKFASKKPPRYKHSEGRNGNLVTSGNQEEARYYGDEGGNIRLGGDYTRFDPVNGDDMLDYDNAYVDYAKSTQNVSFPKFGYQGDQERSRQSQGRGNLNWKSQNVGRFDGRFGVEKDYDIGPSVQEKQVGLQRNGNQYPGQRSVSGNVGQRSQINPGYSDKTFENRRGVDYNDFNRFGLHSDDSHSRGSELSDLTLSEYSDRSKHEYSDRSKHEYSDKSRQKPLQDTEYSGRHQPHKYSAALREQPFPVPFLSDNNATRLLSPSQESHSMSLESLTGSAGDRDSRSTIELLDYDILQDLPSPCQKGFESKPPVPHRHRHVHVGRGTHGICEGSSATPRPGSSDSHMTSCSSHMTSSLRKSPSGVKSGHHVRWDPGVVISEHKQVLIPISELQAEAKAMKKDKKKMSLRSLLNLPKFPLSDDESVDRVAKMETNSGKGDGNDNRGAFRKFLDSKGGLRRKPVGQESVPATKSDLVSLRYKQDHQTGESSGHLKEFTSPKKADLTKLNITQANLGGLTSGSFERNVSVPDYDQLQHTDAINYPLVHSGIGRSIFSPKGQSGFSPYSKPAATFKSPVKSVRPYIINGQANDNQDDYDNFGEGEMGPQNRALISGSLQDTDRSNVLHQGKVSYKTLNEKMTPVHLSTKNTSSPATVVSFDTYVTIGRPTESSVTFDTFVTLGRPYATSTPVPNGSQGFNQYSQYLNKDLRTVGQRQALVHSAQGQSSVHNVTSGNPSSSVTQSWNYSSSGQPPVFASTSLGTVMATGAGELLMQAPVNLGQWAGHVTDHVTSPTNRYNPYVDVLPWYKPQTSGPYEMENREYGKLNLSPTTFLMETPGAEHWGSSQKPLYTQVEGQSLSMGARNALSELITQGEGQSIGARNTRSEIKTQNLEKGNKQSVAVSSAASAHKLSDLRKHVVRQGSPDYDDDVFYNIGNHGNASSQTDNLGLTAKRRLEFEGNTAINKPVVTSCVPQLNHELNHDDTLNHSFSGYPKVQAVPGISQARSPSTMTTNMNNVSGRDHMDGENSCILDLVYITERIISMSFASEEQENTYKYNLKEVSRMLKTKHGENYLVINISEKKPELSKHCPKVVDYGWPDNLAPPLERLCSICKAIDQWMGSDVNHVVVVHCKGGRGRIAVIIAAYMRYSNICASADQALDRFAMKRFYDDKLGGLPQPSQRRYVHYFAGLLSGAIQINSSALYLHHILIHGVPNFDERGGCRPFIKVYQGMHPIFTSGVYNVTDNMQKVCISISPGIPLRGDILIKCYHKKNNAGQREIIWGCQFHTCAISHNSLVFSKNELDYAINDARFPDPGKVEFVFGNNSEGLVQVADFKSDVTVPVDDSTEALTRWDSYENFGKADGKLTDVNANGLQSSQHGVDSFRVTPLDHSQGPVDGSLYAQVNKRSLESQIITNGTTRLANGGSYTSSLDSGISTFSVPVGTSSTQKQTSSENWSYNTREREMMNHQPVSSYSSMSKSYSSTSPRSGKVSLDEQTQLDQILSDLLSDQAYVSQKSSPGTRSFKTVEEHTSPEGNIVVQRGDVTYKIPEVRSEKHYSVKTETRTVSDDKYKPVNAFTYTPASPEMSRSFDGVRSPTASKSPYKVDYENNFKKESSYNYQANGPSSLSDGEHSLSWLQQQQAKLREKSLERDPNRHRNEQMLIEELKKSQTQNKYFQNKSQTEDAESVSSKVSSSALQNGPTSPYSYTVSRTHTYNNDKSPTEVSQFRPHDTLPMAHSHTTYITEQTTSTTSKVSNKPPPSPNLQRAVAPTMHSPPPVPPPQRTSSRDYMQQQQQQQQQQQTRGRAYSGGAYQQQQTSSWKSETHAQPRVIQRHNSESAYDRDHFERQQTTRQFSTPPISPRSVSPHTVQSYKTVYKTVHHKEDEPDFSPPQPMEVKIERQSQKEQHTVYQPPPPPQPVDKPHYITEVIVQRTGGADSKNSTLSRHADIDRHDNADDRLEALERSLQAASSSIIASQPWQQQQQQQQQQLQQQNVIRQEVRQFETRTYETKTEQRHEQRQEQKAVSSGGYPRSMSPTWDNFPEEHAQQSLAEQPKKIEVTEVDRISLKPIGPGIQQLEPEGSVHSTSTLGRDSTLGRATTPSFPISPQSSAATPPFPLTPRTPYTNASVKSSNAPSYQRLPQTFSYGSSGLAQGQGHMGSTTYGQSVSGLYGAPGIYNSQQSLNSVFEHEEPRDYNSIVSRQLMRSVNDPTYASINDTDVRDVKGGSHVISPTGTLQSDRMQYQTQQYQQNQQYQTGNQQYQTGTLPHNSQQIITPGYQTGTLPLQPSFNQQQQYQQQQRQQISSSSYQTQQYSTSSNSHNSHQAHDGSLHVDTNPRMLMTQSARSPLESSPGSPPSPGNLNTLRQQLHTAHTMSSSAVSPGPHSATGQSSPSVYFGLSRRGSLTSLADSEATHTTPRFVKDTSKFWYKPNITREEAIMMLKDKAPGTFVVRDSNSFPGAFGLALKVATLPPNVQTKPTSDPMADLVRHFLIEPTSKGVRLRGCSNEPVFGSLASLVYQHSITPLALPCKLVLPEHDPSHIVADVSPTTEMPSSASQLLAQGAACNVIYLNSVDTESLTGPQAIQKAVKMTFDMAPQQTTQVHFKVSNQGITLTDNQRKLFFRRHYPVAAVTYCGIDPEDRMWKRETDVPGVIADARVFGFVARKQGSVSDNSCHLFCELDPTQPASAIVNFVTKVMIGQGKVKS